MGGIQIRFRRCLGTYKRTTSSPAILPNPNHLTTPMSHPMSLNITTVVSSSKMTRPTWLSSRFRGAVVVGKYSASDSEQATGGNWKKLPQTMMLILPNKCGDRGWPSTISPIAMLRDSLVKNVLLIMGTSSVMRYLTSLQVFWSFPRISALVVLSSWIDIIAMLCVALPSIKDEAAPVYADFISMYFAALWSWCGLPSISLYLPPRGSTCVAAISLH